MGSILQIVGTVVVLLWVAAQLGYGHFTFIYGPEPVQCIEIADPQPEFFNTKE